MIERDERIGGSAIINSILALILFNQIGPLKRSLVVEASAHNEKSDAGNERHVAAVRHKLLVS